MAKMNRKLCTSLAGCGWALTEGFQPRGSPVSTLVASPVSSKDKQQIKTSQTQPYQVCSAVRNLSAAQQKNRVCPYFKAACSILFGNSHISFLVRTTQRLQHYVQMVRRRALLLRLARLTPTGCTFQQPTLSKQPSFAAAGGSQDC
jgi:hypothetical protein